MSTDFSYKHAEDRVTQRHVNLNNQPKKTVGLNINILVKYRKVRNLRKFNHMYCISITDIHTGLITIKLTKLLTPPGPHSTR